MAIASASSPTSARGGSCSKGGVSGNAIVPLRANAGWHAERAG